MFDAWYMGFTPKIVTGTWVGFDEAAILGRDYGLELTATGYRFVEFDDYLLFLEVLNVGQSLTWALE